MIEPLALRQRLGEEYISWVPSHLSLGHVSSFGLLATDETGFLQANIKVASLGFTWLSTFNAAKLAKAPKTRRVLP